MAPKYVMITQLIEPNYFFLIVDYCRNPSLGLVTRAKAYKGVGQEGSPGITSPAPKNVGKYEGMNLTFSSEFSPWELESQWTPKFSEKNFKGQNPLD